MTRKTLASFYPPDLVAKYPESMRKGFQRLMKEKTEREAMPGYQEHEPTANLGEKYSVVEIHWTAKEGKSTGGFICDFTKQKNDKWVFGNKSY